MSEIDSRWSVVVESFSVLFEVLLLDNWVIFVLFTSVEFPDGHGVDWLLQVLLAFQISQTRKRSYNFSLPSYRCLPCDRLQRLLQQCHVSSMHGPKTDLSCLCRILRALVDQCLLGMTGQMKHSLSFHRSSHRRFHWRLLGCSRRSLELRRTCRC